MFIRNCWYVAAWQEELTSQPLARTILGEPVVLYRTASGQVSALEDRCVHRSLPLSMGRVCGEHLVCAYHGLSYDHAGRCVHIPAQDVIPKNAQIRRYPVVEKDSVIWIWMGDSTRADETSVPDYLWHSDPGWAHKKSYRHIAAYYELIHDNLIDLSHVGWVHEKTIGGTPEAHSRAEVKVVRSEDQVSVRRWMRDSVPPPTYVKAVDFKGNIDRWMEIRFRPGLINIYVGANDAGKGVDEDHYRNTFGARIFNGVTPETEHSTHYFWTAAHKFKVDQPAATEALFKEVYATFEEDKMVLESQHSRMRDVPGAPTIDLISDAGGNQARRLVKAKIEEELRHVPVPA
ncbi:aromatic ring-hydroxylating dioxygenase subunit alpha [Paraburkholderia sediminicola]|uniref:aromatic ring-hydroxylating dioxygenase subunit alpha n=1 Tax=Paraburkholderia sediminicola TaxID=458836 RepID=UPI0038BB306E